MSFWNRAFRHSMSGPIESGAGFQGLVWHADSDRPRTRLSVEVFYL